MTSQSIMCHTPSTWYGFDSVYAQLKWDIVWILLVLKSFITTQILGLIDFKNCTKKSDHFKFFLEQILVTSHWELNLICTSKKMQEQKLDWFVGYIALSALGNMLKNLSFSYELYVQALLKRL